MRAFRFAAAMLITPLILAPFTSAHAQMGVSVGIGVAITVAPPMLPVYAQPPMTDLGDIWTPGYWAYGDDDYYWVQGTWVEPPSEGMLWTPGYWVWQNGYYLFHVGYWATSVGYYGGIDYGYGYGGSGYDGGEWRDHHFAYNRAANNFGGFHDNNAYDRPISGDRGERASFNGPHGITAGPTAQQEQADRQGHMQPTAQQARHAQAAEQDRTLRSSVNGGHPAAAATPQPRQMNAPAPARESAPMHESAPAYPAIPQHEAVPERQAAPMHEAAPQRQAPAHEAIPQHEAVPERQAPPMHEAAPQRQAPPQHEAAPPRQASQQREAAPQHQAGPQQHEAAPAHEAPHEEEHH